MSTYNTELMTNHHRPDFAHPLVLVSETLHVWGQRYRARKELAQLTDRDFHDVGSSWSDFAYEANKPFWKA